MAALNATVLAILSPFIGPNVIVGVFGWGLMSRLEGYSLTPVILAAGVVLTGLAIGGLEVIALRRKWPMATRRVIWTTMASFLVGALLSSASIYIVQVALYGLLLPLVCAGLVIWALGLLVPALSPLAWGLKKAA